MLFSNPEAIGFSIGFGENHFSMSRGSFQYDEAFTYKKTLKFVRISSVTERTGSVQTGTEQTGTVHTDTVQAGIVPMGTMQAGSQKEENELLLVFEDPSLPVEYLLSCKQENGLEYLSYAGARGKEGSPIMVKPLLPNRFWITFPADPEEHLYGTGETYSEWDLKGQEVRIFTAEHQNSKRIEEKKEREARTGKDPYHKLPFSEYESYYVQPTVVSSDKYFIHCDTTRFMKFDFTSKTETTLYLQEEPCIVVGEAGSFPELSRKLRDLLGGQRKMPSWVYDGVIAASQRGIDEAEKKVRTLMDAGIPVSAVWCQDWCGCRNNTFGYQVMWNWRYDRELYPDLPERIRTLREKGVRFLGYINPFIALERELYQEAHEKGYLVKDKNGADYLVTITVFPAAMIDFTNPAAYAWYKELIKTNMIGAGLSGWMADFGEYLPTDAVLFNGESAEDWHNRWPAVWAQLNREAIAECGTEDEIFFFMRAGFTGSVKDNLMMWTGDQHVDWSLDDGIGSVIPAMLSLSMSGFGISHSDTGGYTTNDGMKRSEELLMRWEEMNAFSPVMRFHEGNQPWNNVQFDASEELLKHLKTFAAIHEKLAPYLKKCEEELVRDALPVIRPLFYHYEEVSAETEIRQASEKMTIGRTSADQSVSRETPDIYTLTDEYLLGRDLLIAPVLTEGAVSRQVYLPEDDWVDFWTGKVFSGGKVVNDPNNDRAAAGEAAAGEAGEAAAGEAGEAAAGEAAGKSGGRTITVEAPLGRIPVFIRKAAMKDPEIISLLS